MNIFHSIDEFAATGKENNIVTTGTFDGVHLGHRVILEKVCSIAETNHSESVLLTFHPHPRQVLFPDSAKMPVRSAHPGGFFLTTLDERKELLEKSGIQNLIIHPFTKELSQVPAIDYVKNILAAKLKTATFVTGYNHHFGRDRKGSIKDLEEWGPKLGFNVVEVPPLKWGDVAISSSKIRKAMQDGDLQTANDYLGYLFFIHAQVVKGLNIGGKELGYPTANLELTADSPVRTGTGGYQPIANSYNKIVPADGIYAVYVYISGQSSVISGQSLLTTDNRPLTTSIHKGMMSIGMNPTIENKGRSMEVHIFDFNENIYGRTVKISFFRKIRNEEKFNSLAELKAQLDRDKEVCLKLLK